MKTVIFALLIITDLQRKCKNNAEKFGFGTILYYLCSRFVKWGSGRVLCEMEECTGGDGLVRRGKRWVFLWGFCLVDRGIPETLIEGWGCEAEMSRVG